MKEYAFTVDNILSNNLLNKPIHVKHSGAAYNLNYKKHIICQYCYESTIFVFTQEKETIFVKCYLCNKGYNTVSNIVPYQMICIPVTILL